MKFFTSQISYFLASRHTRLNIRRLIRFLLVLTSVIVIYSVLFHFIMVYEGQDHSWVTGLYWTLTVMSTLGFGDITFQSDLGRIFSVIVLMSGMISLLILLPFTFIEFFYAPWLEAQSNARAPRELPPDTKDHVIITHFNPVTRTLIEKLNHYQYSYVLLNDNLNRALELHDEGYRVVVGELDDPQTYKRLHINNASLVITAGTDMVNSNICNTVRELSETVPIVSSANSSASVDLLKLAGSTHVLQMGKMLGRSLARRTIAQDTRVHVVGRFGKMIIAEATVAETPLVGKTLKESQLREKLGINVVGLWERGTFKNPEPGTLINASSVLLIAGSIDQLRTYDEFMAIYKASDTPVIIIGGGRVGRGTAEAFQQRGMDYRLIEKNPDRIRDPGKYILGNAEELDILEEAGIHEAPCVITTTHEDDMNIYLTIYCRQLRPDIQIISRATLERNVSTLHRAGADFVMSYATMGANAVFNIMERNDVVMIAEGLNVFNTDTPEEMEGKSLAETGIRQKTGCSVLAIQNGEDLIINPDPTLKIPGKSELVIIGTLEAESRFMRYFKNGD